MRKLRLDLNALEVESFTVSEEAVRLSYVKLDDGTVEGYSGNIQPGTCDTKDQYACATVPVSACPINTCGQASCEYTCPVTCGNSCACNGGSMDVTCPSVQVSCSPMLCGSTVCTSPDMGCTGSTC